MANIPGHHWQDLKRELMEKWHELTENDLDSTLGNKNSIISLIEKKVGLAMDEASEKFAEMASHYRLYDEPEEQEPTPTEQKKERVLEINPRKPGDKDSTPRDQRH
ncbi:hypothetical protein D3C87_300940 [compost metagenome]